MVPKSFGDVSLIFVLNKAVHLVGVMIGILRNKTYEMDSFKIIALSCSKQKGS